MTNDIIFPESMEKTEGLDAQEVLKIHDDYIRYIVERIRFAFNGYTNRKKFIEQVEDVVDDSTFATNIKKENTARDQAIMSLNEKLDKSEGLYTTVDEESGIVYLHDKQEEPGLLPPYTESRTVIKVTSEAIGISKDGGVTYSWGISLDDGVAILDKIYAIGINADHITTGRITDSAGKYSLDLETGEVTMASADITGGSINIQTDSASTNKISLNHLGEAAYTTDTLSPETINLHIMYGGGSAPPSANNYDDLIIRAARLWMRHRTPADGLSDFLLDVNGLRFSEDGSTTASYPAQPLSWQNFTPAAGTASPFQIAKYLNVVELYGGLTGLSSSATSVNLGTLPYKARNSYAVIPTYQTAAPYLQNGTIWISNTGAITLYKAAATTAVYFSGTFVCQ